MQDDVLTDRKKVLFLQSAKEPDRLLRVFVHSNYRGTESYRGHQRTKQGRL